MEKIKKNNLISRIFCRYAKINADKKDLGFIKSPSVIFFKKPLEASEFPETEFAKLCWNEISCYKKNLMKWKIANNIPFYLKGFKSKKHFQKQKKMLKKSIIKKF